MFLLRDIAPGDLDGLQKAAVHLDSVNLPDDRASLAAIVERSRASFAGELPIADRCFVFVAVEVGAGGKAGKMGEVAGTSMIFAQHGNRRAPHVFFDVLEEERYSDTLDRHFTHRVLRIGYNYKGLTEIGGLVLRPEFRRHPERLGRSLAYVRFLYLARHRQLFRDEVLSELMPPLEADGTSLLWEALGRKFTGLSYQEADRLSQSNKEFIRALFPQDPLYATLLPAHVQALIGEVGPHTKGVEKMLREVGFSYAHRIDPFDGGPHFHARTDDITLVKAARTARVADAGYAPIDAGGRRQVFLVARERPAPPCFAVARIELPSLPEGERVSLPDDVRRALEVTAGDEVAILRIA
ncbi:MAG TPA: arginine N-succinyltransferase [Polyangia bacterium]|jgi:arginine N-succinyltransferase|nr:arginine N-succinyltransferase [Polyangia bacterium]